MTKIALTGTYCSCNKGDAAMELGALQALGKLIPDAEFTIHTPFPEIDRQVYKATHLFKSSRRQLIKSFFLLSRCLAWSFFLKRLKTDFRFLVRNPELQEYAKSDIVVDLSGDTLTEDYGIHVTISHLFPILIGMSLQKPVVLYAQTIGPFRIMGPIARPVLSKAALITVRESISRDYLRKIKIPKPIIHLTADSAFLLEPAGEERSREIMSEEGVDEDDRPIIGMTVSRLIGHRFSIGQSGSKHGSFSTLMAEVADYVIEKMGATVVFFSHVTGPTESKDDRVIARQVWQKVKEKSKAKVIAGDYTPEEIKGIIGKCELFIGVRMHSNISSASMHVPTIAISYSHKTSGIMKTIGQEKWVCHIDKLTLEDLISKIDAAWSDRENIKTELVAKVRAVRQLAFQNAELVKGLLDDIKKERSDAVSMAAV